MKSILLLFCFLIAGSWTHAQKINGIITDEKSDEFLIGALVIADETKSTSSRTDGSYTLELTEGSHILEYSFIGYEPIIKEISLAKGEILTINIQLIESNTSLNVAVISAGKFEQKLEELTVSMEVIQPNLIEDKNTTSIEDALQQAPGVVIVDSEPQIRSGSGYSFGAGSRVMIMVDDLPLMSGDAGRPSWGFFAVENIEQIEIIKGASSVLYGSGALNGVINIRTAYPRSEPKTKLTLFHGVYSDPKTEEAKYWDRTPLISGANFLHSRQIGNLDLVAGASILIDESFKGPYLDTTKAYLPLDPQRADATSRARVNLNLRYRSKKYLGLTYGINTNWLVGSSVATLLWDNTTSGLYAPYDGSATRTDQVIGNLDPFINYLTPSGQKHSLKTRWHNLDNDNDTRSADNPEGGANQDNFSDFYYSEYQYQRNFDSLGVKNFNLTAGVMSMFTFSNAQLYSGENSDGKNEARNIASYLQLDKKVGDRLNLSAGIRYEYFKINGVDESKPVFRSGLSYRFGQETYIRASYGQGFRFPTIAEKFITTSVGGVSVYPSLDLKPETSENIEIGLKQGFKIGKFLGYIDIAAFQQSYENFIEFTFGFWGDDANILQNFGFKSLNTGKAEVSGLELSVLGKGKVGKVDFTLLAGYTYTNPVSTTPEVIYGTSTDDAIPFDASYNSTSSDPSDKILKYRFKNLIRFDLEGKFKKFTAGFSARYNSKTENIDLAFVSLDEDDILPTGIGKWLQERNNGDLVLDLRCSYRINNKLKAAVIIGNLLNREYALRPLSIESPRLTTFQLSFDL